MTKPLIVLEFTNGRSESATLSRPFQPETNAISAVLKRSGQEYTFHLSELCAVMLEDFDTTGLEFGSKEPGEEIMTTSRKIFQARTCRSKILPTGVIGQVMASGTPFKFIFFPYSGIQTRRPIRPVGEILIEIGVVSRSGLEETLRIQQEIRGRRLGEILSKQTGIDHEIIEKTLKESQESGKHPPNLRVGEYLVAAGLITEEQVQQALKTQQQMRQKKIGALLVERGLAKEEFILTALASKFRLRFVNLDIVAKEEKARQLISKEVAQRMKILPLEHTENRLLVATATPENIYIAKDLYDLVNIPIDLVVALPGQIEEAIAELYP